VGEQATAVQEAGRGAYCFQKRGYKIVGATRQTSYSAGSNLTRVHAWAPGELGMEVTDPAYFGITTFGESEEISIPFSGDPSRTIRVTRTAGQWRPPERFTDFLPEDFTVPLWRYTGPDGLRRIVPNCSFEELIDLGAVGGLAVVRSLRHFGKDYDHSYRAMNLIHQWVCGRNYRGRRGLQEHRTRKFKYSRDLFVRPLGRETKGKPDVLPEHVRLTVTGLIKQGREAAHEAGHCNPSSKEAISFGLYESARLDPLEVESDRVRNLVLGALFDTDGHRDPPSQEIIDIVTERLLEAIHRHLADPREAFESWFFGSDNTLIRQIAKQRKKPGGAIPHEDVRRTLLHLGIRAYDYLGACIHALMRTIKNSIPEPLNEQEKRIFEHMHETQPYYGNLPVALLAERMEEIQQAVAAIWTEPENPEHIRVLHRLLHYYDEMAQLRRQADVRSKQRCGQRRRGTKSAGTDAAGEVENDSAKHAAIESDVAVHASPRGCETEFIESVHSPICHGEDDLCTVADHIRELRKIECPADCGEWSYEFDHEPNTNVRIHMLCRCEQTERVEHVPLDELAREARKVLG
jgi:hypothetical protein